MTIHMLMMVWIQVWKKLDPLRERNTFEVFGWDFLLDEEMNVWVRFVFASACTCTHVCACLRASREGRLCGLYTPPSLASAYPQRVR